MSPIVVGLIVVDSVAQYEPLPRALAGLGVALAGISASILAVANGEELGLAPRRGVADLEALLGQTRQAGLPVELTLEGTPSPLPPGLDLSAYRIVQEALTNARKHADDVRAHVTPSCCSKALEIEVLDDGPASGNGTGGGYGPVGLRERVAVFGGSLEVGPRPAGGFAVRARLPLQGATG